MSIESYRAEVSRLLGREVSPNSVRLLMFNMYSEAAAAECFRERIQTVTKDQEKK